jgi:hypothetical protein
VGACAGACCWLLGQLDVTHAPPPPLG